MANHMAKIIASTNGIIFLGLEFMMFFRFLNIFNLFFTNRIYKNNMTGIVISIIAVITHGAFGNIGDIQKYKFVIN